MALANYFGFFDIVNDFAEKIKNILTIENLLCLNSNVKNTDRSYRTIEYIINYKNTESLTHTATILLNYIICAKKC